MPTMIVYCPSKAHSTECTPKEAKAQARVWKESGCRLCKKAAEKAKETNNANNP